MSAGLLVLVLLAAYLIGSLPFGFLAAKLVAGVDIRHSGSGNIGATNVGRVLGMQWGVAVLVLDAAKGLAPTLFLPALLAATEGSRFQHLQVGCAVAAILGHMFPCWLRFRGGKGVATALGAIMVLSPWGTLAGAAVFAAVLAVSRIVSLSSMLAALAFAGTQLALMWPAPFAAEHWSLAAFSLGVPALIVYRHRTNVVRLWNGTEPTIRSRRTETGSQEKPSEPSGREESDNAPGQREPRH